MTEATKKKHVAREVINSYELPGLNQQIVQVIRGCGNNLHEVVTSTGEQFLVSMPTKFRRSVWIKKGDYLIVTQIDEGNKVRAEIHSILLKDQIRFIKENGVWPNGFEQSSVQTRVDHDDDHLDDLLTPNTNRVYFDSSDSESDQELYS